MGVLNHSAVIEGLVRAGKIKADDIDGQWEAYRQIVVDNPFPKVSRALVIVGADRRGAVYGAYDLSEKIGVSPWYWFADVPVRRASERLPHCRIPARPAQGEISWILHQR